MITRRTLTAAERERAVHAPFACATGSVIEMRAGGVKLAGDSADVKALLAAAVAREQVELEVDLLAYEQERGKRNYNCFRFKDGAMPSLGKSGVGTVYLRDHAKWNTEAVSGRIIASRTERVAEGHYQILQTVSVREPAAVERALRGLLGAVSIGAWATGPVTCSHCETEVLEECWHWPGDVVKGAEGEPDQVVEWVYSSAILKETSEVPIGAVPTAGAISIRAAIEAAITGGPHAPVDHVPGGSSFALAVTASPSARPPTQETTMKNRAAIVAKLKLAGLLAACANPAEPTDAELEAGLDELLGDRAELGIARKELSTGQTSAVEAFIKDGQDTGRIAPAEADDWRAFFAASPDRARERMGKRAPNSATPVGAPRQREAAEPTEVAAAAAAKQSVDAKKGTTERDGKAKQVLTAAGRDYDLSVRFAKAFGAKDPKGAIAKYAAGITEEN